MFWKTNESFQGGGLNKIVLGLGLNEIIVFFFWSEMIGGGGAGGGEERSEKA